VERHRDQREHDERNRDRERRGAGEPARAEDRDEAGDRPDAQADAEIRRRERDDETCDERCERNHCEDSLAPISSRNPATWCVKAALSSPTIICVAPATRTWRACGTSARNSPIVVSDTTSLAPPLISSVGMRTRRAASSS